MADDKDLADSGLNEMGLQIARILKNGSSSGQNQNQVSEKISLNVRLNGENYPLWSRLMEVEIDVRGCGGHITGGTLEPAATDPNFFRWRQEDLRVFSWILQNLKPRLMNNVARYKSAKALWDALAVTYDSGGDELQIYDLHSQACRQIQGERTLEEYWNALQALWLAIDDR